MALNRVASMYTSEMQRHPLRTNIALGGAIASLGDVICQCVEGATLESFSTRRMLEMGSVRACVMSPILHFYFPLLARLVPLAPAGAPLAQRVARVAARVFVDQAVGSPVTLVLIFGATSLVKGRPEDAQALIEQNLVPTWYAGAHYWPVIHSFNFGFIAPTKVLANT